MNSTEYGQLLIFQRIAEEGSIAGCARVMGISVPAVSKALKQLEKRLGVPLFQRSTRRIQLTETGIQLLAQTKGAVANLSQAFENAKAHAEIAQGTVRITLSQVAFALILQPVYAEFCRRFPQILLDISINNATVNIIDEKFDLGIRFGNSLEDGIVARRLTPPIREGLYASKRYAQQHGLPQTIDELAQHRLIGYRFITANRFHPLTLMENGQPRTIEMPFSLICNDSEMAIDAIRQGIGIGRIFEPQWQQQPDKADFIPVLEAHWQPFPPHYLYFQPQAQKAKRVQVVIDFLLGKSGRE